MTVDLRPLARADFLLLGAWLAEPLVARWWHHDPRPAALERDFGPSVDGADPTEMFIATLHGQPFGLIQRYRSRTTPSGARSSRRCGRSRPVRSASTT